MKSVARGPELVDLPGAEPVLVLIASPNPTLLRHLDEDLIAQAASIDIRSGVVWIETDDGRAFLQHLVESTRNHEQIRVAFAQLDAPPQELIQRSLLSTTLQTVADQLEQDELASSELEYEVRYQPIVRLSNRSVVGFEALLRARLGNEVLTAENLIARANKGGWLADLDQLGRQLAVRGVGPWLGAGLLFLNMMAPDGTFDLAAARRTIRQAEDIGLDPDQIVLETAERNRYVDIDLAAAQLNKLRNSGVRIAIDDVGDGYSSLRVATSFKPDVLKLAGHLIAALPSEESKAIIKAVVELAHETGAWVVAENVETEAQAAALAQLDVDWGQGILFGRPQTLDAG